MMNYADHIAAVQNWIRQNNLAGYFVPRADEVQGEYVMPCDARLEWLCGFDGSAGIALLTPDRMALVVDGRYTTQAAEQMRGLPVDVCHFIESPWTEWLQARGVTNGAIGFDPRLFTPAWRKAAAAKVEKLGLTLRAVTENPADVLWQGRPAASNTAVEIFPDALAGRNSIAKRRALGHTLAEQGAAGALITDPTGIAWLLNIRANDLEATPVAISRLILRADGSAAWYIDAARVGADVVAHMGEGVAIQSPATIDFGAFSGRTIAADEDTVNIALCEAMEAARAKVAIGPCVTELPKAVKNNIEVAGMAAAHRRDGVALARFMHWLDTYVKPAPTNFKESDVVAQLESCRARANEYRGPSFSTICGTGAHGAIIHYRVTPATDVSLENNTLLLIDSGGQYIDGTTDVTRVFAFGAVTDEMRRAYTAVLRGHIALATARFPKGTAGGPLDGLARAPLWQLGLDFDHGTGHGVGHYLSVHEGPQNISSRSTVALQPGMVVSNEPGFYKPGAYGIRIENLITVVETDVREPKPFYAFETLTVAPYERALIVVDDLTVAERTWLNAYHTRVLATIGPQVEPDVREWLAKACAPL